MFGVPKIIFFVLPLLQRQLKVAGQEINVVLFE